MILRRLSNGIRQQDWFVVLIEILVLVIGVYIGLQVDDWKQTRQDRADEKEFIGRLHDDIMGAQELSSRPLERRMQRWHMLPDLADMVFGRIDRKGLTADECTSAVSLHYFNIIISDLSTVAELMATGRMGIIQNTELLTALSRLEQTRDAVNTMIIVNQKVTYDLAASHPDLVTRDAYFDQETQEIRGHYSCDFEGMKKNQTFLNQFAANADAYDGYVRDGLKPWLDQFGVVHALVDAELGINHANDQKN
jgi:hypothetical protein